MLDKLQAIEQRFNEVQDLIIQPDIISDQKRYVQLNQEYKTLKELVDEYKIYQGKLNLIEEADAIIADGSDPDMVELAKSEKDDVLEELPEMEEKLRTMLIPKDPEDHKNAIVELRAGTGGDESCIFVEDVMRMYTMYFKNKGWSYEVINAQEGSVSGFREVVLGVKGEDVFGTLKFESGVHRVQRVPDTESQGRVHTSAITVAVLPESEEVDEVEINPADIKRDTFRASGAGGQHVNKTDSAIRLTHIPTGIVAECQEERSQHKNYDKALKYLKAKLYQVEYDKSVAERAALRKSLVSTGDRSAKIRTYNYPQGRVTDHRINLTLYNLSDVLNGDMQKIIDELFIAENAEKLKAGETL